MKSALIKTLLFALVFFFALPVHAASPGDVVISEIMYNLEGADNPREWVEIYNTSNSSVDLADWRFNDGKNHKLNPPPEKGGQARLPLRQSSITIQPGEYAILADDAETFLADHPGFVGTVIDTVMSLKNTSSTLSLVDDIGNVIDSTPYQNTWGADGNGKTLEKTGTGWQESVSAKGTPGTPFVIYTPPPPPDPTLPSSPAPPLENVPDATLSPLISPTSTESNPFPLQNSTEDNSATSTPMQESPIQYPSNISINEIMPYPAGPDDEGEWIEIYNGNDEQTDVSNWQLRDMQGSTKTFTFPKGTTISGNAYLVLSRPTTKITLNNAGDGIELLQPDGESVQVVEFGKTTKGKSYAKNEDVWKWTDVPTPGSANILSQAPAKTSPKKQVSANQGTNLPAPPIDQTDGGQKSQVDESKKINSKNIASIGSSVGLGASPKSNNFVPYFLAPAVALLSALFMFVLKKRF